MAALLAAGCAEGLQSASVSTAAKSQASAEYARVDMSRAASPLSAPATDVTLMSPLPASAGGMMGSGGMMGTSSGEAHMEGGQAAASGAAEVPPALNRKIIYTADIGLIVEDFPRAESTIRDLVARHRGYVAEMALTGSPGVNRSARWKVRVPVETFEAFLSEAGSVGELERSSRSSADVSEEFYDLDARIRNKKVEETRLIKILEENAGKLEEVLRVETELSRVRGEVERMEGRMRVLENLTSMTTVTIDVRERVKFEPAPPVAASFPTRLTRAFDESWRRLREFGENLAIGLAEAWTFLVFGLLPALLVGLLVLRALLRRLPGWLRRGWAALNTRLTPPPTPPAA